ncbi:MAG: mechanosensitive ion channel domain-containing protein [Pseudomonadota bacterium]
MIRGHDAGATASGSRAKRLRRALALALFVTWGLVAHAQLASPILQERTAAPAAIAAPSLLEQLDEARAQVRQARELRDSQSEPGRRQDLALDRQRLLDWLVDLHQEKVKCLEELLTLSNMPVSSVEEDPLTRALRQTPPYSAVQVDALRDEIDGLKEKLAAAEASLRANKTEMQNLHEQRKARAAALRQAGDRAVGAGADAHEAGAREEFEILALLERTAEVEIAVSALDQERLQLRISSLRRRIADMQNVVASVLPEQTLSLEDLAAQRQRVRSEQEKLASEIDMIARQNARHRAERDRLGADSNAGRRGAFLDLALKADNAMLKGLDQLQILNSVSGDAWEKRAVLLSGSDPVQVRQALQALNELVRKLADWRSQSRARQEGLRTEIHAQRIRIDNLAANPREQAREKEILNLLQRQTAMDERVELAAARLDTQVSRWLADFAEPGDMGWREYLARVSDRLVVLLKRIWQQELFVAEDVSQVDGRQVSVKYGVTVGKSVGILVVFIAGYWLLARISRFIQRQLVRWLKVSPQFASVVRRWSMIALSFGLVVLLLNLARIPLSVFAFLGGALAIGLGFGAQTIIKNFISGLIVLFERKVRVGDVVELGGVTGYVTAVDLRATTVRSFNGVEALIPNADFIENQVVNWTYSNRQVRRELSVDIAYGTDVRQAETLFLGAAAGHSCVLAHPAPEVFFDGFGDSALKVVLVYWVEFDGPKGPRRVDSDLRHDIYGRLDASGITMPFPQRDVHVSFVQPASVPTAKLESILAL